MVGTLNKNDEAYGDNNLYHIGKILSDIGSIVVGGLGMAGGGALAGGGLVLDGTGVGAIAGVPANLAGVAIATSSGVVAKNGTQNIIKDASDLISNIKSGKDSNTPELIKTGDKTSRGRSFSEHGAERANERDFSKDTIDSIIDNNMKTRKSKVDDLGRKTWEYTDARGNKVVTNESGGIISVHSPLPGGTYIPKK
ncbi:hypothetical protein PGRAN_08509 [Listeria grandensis FSL F6-0971]|uniref:Uncharacterized protein n=1 Tax=Listeria grandensis FSL F6-0971 TaxID=1265819 RepID=W7B810_9LIST|nr:hypothetical protein [Listeria grandensis]EUJ23389.1 hypothetical protein PGRAN_08509 [Listeria grandensis FSL F6-0971]